MHSRLHSVLILILLYVVRESDNVNKERFPEARGFLIYRTVSITQKSCTCATQNSCSCCQNVIILYKKAEKSLCVNFTYQRNGLNVEVSLSSDIIRTRTIQNYKPVKFCVYVPGCLFSSACINIVEINEFPRSITVCLRLDIYSKKQLWQINYDCVSISTELPTMESATTMVRTASTLAGGMDQPTQPTGMPMTMPTVGSTMSVATMTTMMPEGMGMTEAVPTMAEGPAIEPEEMPGPNAEAA